MSPTVRGTRITLYDSGMLEVTEQFKEASIWAAEILGSKNTAKYYMASENFLVAYKSTESFTFVITGEPSYSQMYGPHPYFDERCDYLSVTGSEPDLLGKMQKGRGFQFWEAQAVNQDNYLELLTDADEINLLIDEHAPDSSVRPGDDEEVFWGGIRNDDGELIACAVLVQWQSGFHVMASVVTREAERGKGYATQLSSGMVTQAHALGIKEIGLGVRTTNIAAQRAYSKAGFRQLAEFTNYSRE